MRLLFIIVSLLVSNISIAGVYKCKINGVISYQSIPCKNKKSKQVKIKKQPKIDRCEVTCRVIGLVCRSKLKYGNYNSDGGLKVCKLKQKSCFSECHNKGRYTSDKLKYKLSAIEYKYKLRKEQREKEYLEREEKRYKERISREISYKESCIDRKTRSFSYISSPSERRRARRRSISNAEEVCENIYKKSIKKIETEKREKKIEYQRKKEREDQLKKETEL